MMTCLQTDTEEDRFTVIMRAVCGEIRVTLCPIQSCSTISTLILAWSVFTPVRWYQYESPATFLPLQATSGHGPTQVSMPRPHESSRDLSSGTWNKTQGIYFSHRRRPIEVYLILKGRDISFVNLINTSVSFSIEK
jgi:hypothetical protein